MKIGRSFQSFVELYKYNYGREVIIMSKNLGFNINLYTDGEMFFDILKAFIRDYKDSTWPHEIERATFARELFKKALGVFEEGIEVDGNRVQEGFYTEKDLEILKEMRVRLDYWKKKYEELVD
jgi:hypothetical protein